VSLLPARAVLFLFLALTSCAPAPDPLTVPVAHLPGKTLTVADLDAYLEANLLPYDGGTVEDSDARRDLARVKSRLFDAFLDEEILYLEAQRQGIEVKDDEVETYLNAGGEEVAGGSTPERRREMARRDIAIQKIREAWVRSRAQVTPDEVDAYLGERRETITPGRHLVLRSLRLASEEQASRVRAAVAGRHVTFDEAVVTSGAGPGQGEPLEVDLGSLPVEVQAAVSHLKPGEVSGPVVVQGSTYLFFVAEWRAGEQDDESLRGRARDELLRKKYEEASRELVDGLRKRIEPKVQLKNLPFKYVPEDPR